MKQTNAASSIFRRTPATRPVISKLWPVSIEITPSGAEKQTPIKNHDHPNGVEEKSVADDRSDGLPLQCLG
jgi:hypothetical protein